MVVGDGDVDDGVYTVYAFSLGGGTSSTPSYSRVEVAPPVNVSDGGKLGTSTSDGAAYCSAGG